jgi:hypothetical protein
MRYLFMASWKDGNFLSSPSHMVFQREDIDRKREGGRERERETWLSVYQF